MLCFHGAGELQRLTYRYPGNITIDKETSVLLGVFLSLLDGDRTVAIVFIATWKQ